MISVHIHSPLSPTEANATLPREIGTNLLSRLQGNEGEDYQPNVDCQSYLSLALRIGLLHSEASDVSEDEAWAYFKMELSKPWTTEVHAYQLKTDMSSVNLIKKWKLVSSDDEFEHCRSGLV
jgi:hypothetical protein